MFGLAWFDVINFIVSAVSLGIAVVSIFKAHSAKSAVDAVIAKKDDQLDLKRLSDLINLLSSVKLIAMRRQSGTPESHNQGHSFDNDYRQLQLAADALKTKLPAFMDQHMMTAVSSAADQLDFAIKSISASEPDRDGWRDALSTLQTIIPSLEQVDREVENKHLRLS